MGMPHALTTTRRQLWNGAEESAACDSRSRQSVLEVVLFRQPAIKNFQRSHARFDFFCPRFTLFSRTRVNLSSFLSVHLLSSSSSITNMNINTCSKQGQAPVFTCTLDRTCGCESGFAEVTQCGERLARESRASNCKPNCSF